MLERYKWRKTLEAICIPIGAVLAALIIFGLFCAVVGANPFEVYGSIYKAGLRGLECLAENFYSGFAFDAKCFVYCLASPFGIGNYRQ